MGKIVVNKGDLFASLEGRPSAPCIIPHVCNDVGGWGSGFVLAVTGWDTAPEDAYRAMTEYKLGYVDFVEVGEHVVANMIAQHDVGCVPGQRPPIRYGALVKCMTTLRKYAEVNDMHVIRTPRFGSGLAGGDAKVINELMLELWCDRGLDVYVYEL